MSGYINAESTGGYDWEVLSGDSTMPYSGCIGGSLLNYNNKLHLLGSSSSSNKTNHYSWDGLGWVQEPSIPTPPSPTLEPYESLLSSSISYDGAIVHQDKIYAFINAEYHILVTPPPPEDPEEPQEEEYDYYNNAYFFYPFNGVSWGEPIINVHYNENSVPISYDDKIYFLGGIENVGGFDTNAVIIFNGTSCNYGPNMYDGTSEIAFNIAKDYTGCAVVYDGKIHVLGAKNLYGSGSHILHYSFDGSNWTRELDMPVSNIIKSVVFNNYIYVFYGFNTYKYNGEEWIESVGYERNGIFCSLDDYIHELTYVISPSREYRHYVFSDGQGGVPGGIKKIKRAWFPVPQNEYQLINKKPYRVYENKQVIKAWMKTVNGLKIVLEAVESYFKFFKIPEEDSYVSAYLSTSLIFNGLLYLFMGWSIKTFDGEHWNDVTPPNMPTGASTRNIVVANNRIHVLWEKNHWSWDGKRSSNPVIEKDLPFSLGWGGASFVVNVNGKDEIYILQNTNHYAIKENGTNYKVSTLPYDFLFGVAYYDIEFSKYILAGGVNNNETIYYHSLVTPSSNYWTLSDSQSARPIDLQHQYTVLCDANGEFTDGSRKWSLLIPHDYYNDNREILIGLGSYSISHLQDLPSSVIGYPFAAAAFHSCLYLFTEGGASFGNGQYKGTIDDSVLDGFTFKREDNFPMSAVKELVIKYNDEIHMVWGASGTSSESKLRHYILRNGEWVTGSTDLVSSYYNINLIGSRSRSNVPFVSAVNDNKMIILNCINTGSTSSVVANIFNGTKWYNELYDEQGKNLYFSRKRCLGMVSHNNKLYLLGGYWGNDGSYYRYVAVSANNARTWSIVPGSYIPSDLLTSSGNGLKACAVVYVDKIHVVADNDTSIVHYTYDPETNVWEKQNTNPPSDFAYVGGIQNNKIYILGCTNNRYKIYYLKNNKWIVSDNDLYLGNFAMHSIIPLEKNFYMFSNYECYRSNLEKVFY